MPHFRTVTVDDREYQYMVGPQATFVRGVGTFSHFGYCVDCSMDKFAVSPRAVRAAIRRHLFQAEVRRLEAGPRKPVGSVSADEGADRGG